MLRILWNLLGLPLKFDTGSIKKKSVPCVPEKNIYSVIIGYCVPYVPIKNIIWNVLLQGGRGDPMGKEANRKEKVPFLLALGSSSSSTCW